MDGHATSFGPFRLLAGQRLLLEDDRPVRIGSRAFDILAALVERAGEVVGKDELIARAWPQTFVEDSNLKIQVSALRRALGDGQNGHRYVVTVPGRGYNFVAPVSQEERPPAPPPLVASSAPHNLPHAVTRMIGRDDAVATLVSRLPDQRLLTIVGPGGIGKTTVALAVAERVISRYEHGVWLVDLAPLADPRLVPSAVATVLGLASGTKDPLPGLVAGLRDEQMLLLLDNCEHVIDAAATLAAVVLGGAPGVSILATSREPLATAGEGQYRLGSLGLPRPSSEPTAAEAAVFPAVQLFVARVTAIAEDFALTDANAPLVVEICRKLDGLPLAIEFAAPRVAVLGVEGLAARLDDSLPLLDVRQRTAVPRHRTMRAVVDWSYGLLSEDEQRFFCTLGIFAGGFSRDAAAAVAERTPFDTIDRLADLVAKSLVVADVSSAEPRFRLLDTTRAYAIKQLDESSDRRSIARRHAEYYRDLFERAEKEAAVRPAREWLADYAHEIDNLRAALDWAFSADGDGAIGVRLIAAAVPLWLRLSLLDECRSRVKQLLGDHGTGGSLDPRDEMRLSVALGASSSDAPEMGAAFTKALGIAENLGDVGYQLRALQGLQFYHAANHRYRAALPFAQKFHDLAMRGSDQSVRLAGECMIGSLKHTLGDQPGARLHLEQVLTHYAASNHAGKAIRLQDFFRFGIEVQMSARVFLARVLWLQGFPDQALRAAETSLEEAAGHDYSVCYALAFAACPIALWVGNLTAAAHYAAMLLGHSRRHGSPLWAASGSRFHEIIALKGGVLEAKPRLAHSAPDETAKPSSSFQFLTGLSELAEAVAHTGQIAKGLALLEAEIERSEANWLTPELLRLKGELLVLQGAPAAEETSGALFGQALEEACRQGALSWELRTATSLARRLRRQGRAGDAAALLQPVYGRFTEGFGTADLIAAKELLAELDDAGRR